MKQLVKFARAQIKSLVRHLEDFNSYQQTEMLHEIRVDVKKIKAVLNATNYCRSKFKAHKAFIPFRNIFRKAGAIREPDVMFKLLVAYQIEKVQESKLGSDKSQLIQTFRDDIPLFIKTARKEWKKLKPVLTKVHRKDFKNYLLERIHDVELHLSPKPIMKDIHKTRKTIKEILYLSKVNNLLSPKDDKFYGELENVIGQLHDKQMLLDLLSKSNGKDGDLRLNMLKSQCSVDKESITNLALDYYKAGEAIEVY